jgi:hypothetical protein
MQCERVAPMTPSVAPTASGSDVEAAGHPVRLVWAPGESKSRLAGAWWPRTRDATTELQALLPAVTERVGGAASGVSLNIDAWDADQQRRLRVGNARVRVGWFHVLDPATVTLGRSGQDRLILVVIPSDTDTTVGEELLQRLSTTLQWPETAGEALGADAGRGERSPWGG